MSWCAAISDWVISSTNSSSWTMSLISTLAVSAGATSQTRLWEGLEVSAAEVSAAEVPAAEVPAAEVPAAWISPGVAVAHPQP
jgi:hypothetical protein